MIRARSTAQNTRTYWVIVIQPIRHLLIAGLMSGLTLTSSPISAWAAVHQCVDKTGKTVLTNRPAGLRHCRVIVEDTVAGSKSTDRKSNGATEPTDSDMASTLAEGLSPMPPLDDSRYSRMDSLNTPPPNPSPPPSPDQPCPPGVNPLNPLNDVPCNVRSDPQPGGTIVPR